MTLAYTNYCQLYIAFMQILIIIHHLKFQEIFLISQKRSLKYGLKVYYRFLNDRHQRVVINGQHSDWAPILAAVPQGSILRPLIFLIYINDLPDNLNSLVKLFTDDTSLHSMVHDPTLSGKILKLVSTIFFKFIIHLI